MIDCKEDQKKEGLKERIEGYTEQKIKGQKENDRKKQNERMIPFIFDKLFSVRYLEEKSPSHNINIRTLRLQRKKKRI